MAAASHLNRRELLRGLFRGPDLGAVEETPEIRRGLGPGEGAPEAAWHDNTERVLEQLEDLSGLDDAEIGN